jgi:hypothetical protein
MNNIYCNKYLKYKIKYFKLKNQKGGQNENDVKCLNKISPKISGPVSCTRHRINDGEYIKDIYIFGEVHEIINPCKEGEGEFIEIQDYLEKLFLNPKKLIDFFYEVPIQKDFEEEEKEEREEKEEKEEEDRPNPQSKDDFLNKIRNKFRNCLLKKSCPYQKVRFHYTDPRNTDLEIPYWEIVKILGPGFLSRKLPEAYSGKIKKVNELTQEELCNFYYQKSDEIYEVCINEIFPMINDIVKSRIGLDYLYKKYAGLLESYLLNKEINKAGRYSHKIQNFSTSKIKQIIEEDYWVFNNFFNKFYFKKDDKETFKIIIGTNYLNILENIDDIIHNDYSYFFCINGFICIISCIKRKV